MLVLGKLRRTLSMGRELRAPLAPRSRSRIHIPPSCVKELLGVSSPWREMAFPGGTRASSNVSVIPMVFLREASGEVRARLA
jgi:hypothetical protein